jgi:hypothetical protein
MWILGGLGVAGALFWWTHRASAAGLQVPMGSVSAARYSSARSGVAKQVLEDERVLYGDVPPVSIPGVAPDSRRMTDAQIDQITQAWLRQDPRELGALSGQLRSTNYTTTATVISLVPPVS